MRPTPCLPSDTIVAYMSPFIAGTPPASSSGRGRGTIISSLFSLEGTPCVPPSRLGEETASDPPFTVRYTYFIRTAWREALPSRREAMPASPQDQPVAVGGGPLLGRGAASGSWGPLLGRGPHRFWDRPAPPRFPSHTILSLVRVQYCTALLLGAAALWSFSSSLLQGLRWSRALRWPDRGSASSAPAPACQGRKAGSAAAGAEP